jgi:hypothetical protein
MYQEIELWKAEQAKKREKDNNATKLVTDYSKATFDVWMADLIKRNGVTKY